MITVNGFLLIKMHVAITKTVNLFFSFSTQCYVCVHNKTEKERNKKSKFLVFIWKNKRLSKRHKKRAAKPPNTRKYRIIKLSAFLSTFLLFVYLYMSAISLLFIQLSILFACIQTFRIGFDGIFYMNRQLLTTSTLIFCNLLIFFLFSL